MTPEGKTKSLVDRLLKKRRAWFFKPVSNGYGSHGVPDYICCVPVVITQDMVGKTVGVFAAIEAKAPGRRGEKRRGATPLQVDKMAEILDAGGYAAVVDGQDDLDKLFHEADTLSQNRNWEVVNESPEKSPRR